MSRTRPAFGVATTVASGLLFAANGTVSKLVLRAGLEPDQLTALRATGAFAGLLVLGLALRPRRNPPITHRSSAVTHRELVLLAAYGVVGFFAVPLLYFVAISRLPVGIALLFEYTAPLLVALWARFGQRRPVRPRLWGGLALSLTGLACVADVWDDLRLNAVGVLAGFGAAVGLALYYLLGAHGIQRRDTVSLNTWAFGFAAVAGLLTQVVPGARDWSALGGTSHGVPVWLLCCSVVVLGSIAPYLLVAAALRHLPATSVGIIGMVEPVVAAAVAWLALDEALTATQLTGGALILVGVGLAETARIAAPAETELVGTGTGRRGPVDKVAVMRLHPNVQAVQDALESAGAVDASGQTCRVRLLPGAVHTAPAAAAALGVEVGQIANSLIFDADGAPLLVLTSGAHRVDTGKVARLLGAGAVRRAKPEFVREHTGQPIGGVAPVGHPEQVRTLVDTALAQYGEVWAAGGVPRAIFAITPGELARITDGKVTDVA